jgi:hypothetical protein
MKITIDYYRTGQAERPFGAQTEYQGFSLCADADTPEHAKYLLIQKVKAILGTHLPPRETVNLEEPDLEVITEREELELQNLGENQ